MTDPRMEKFLRKAGVADTPRPDLEALTTEIYTPNVNGIARYALHLEAEIARLQSELINANEKPLRCRDCAGSGKRFNGLFTESCSPCKGSGRRSLREQSTTRTTEGENGN